MKHFRLPATSYFAGVVAMTVSQFKHVNGFSNLNLGAGDWDADMFNR